MGQITEEKIEPQEAEIKIKHFLRTKTDLPFNVEVRIDGKKYDIFLYPQISLSDFMGCKFKWKENEGRADEVNFHLMSLEIKGDLIRKNFKYDGLEPRINIVWPDDVSSYVNIKKKEINNFISNNFSNNEVFKYFNFDINYFFCASKPLIKINYPYTPLSQSKDPEKQTKINKLNYQIDKLISQIYGSISTYPSLDRNIYTNSILDRNQYLKYEDEKRKKDFNNFLIKATQKYGDIYEYDYDNFISFNEIMKVFCKKHQSFFEVYPYQHIGWGKKCPIDNESKGETSVRVILSKNKIEYKQYHKMEGCFVMRNDRCILLTFDFYLPKHNTVIEYDGRQHYEPVKYFGGDESYNRQVMLDGIKNKFCKDNNINLIRIPYTVSTRKDIEKYIKERL